MKILWYLKQLFPLTYKSKYKIKEEQFYSVWKMWLGKCYNIKTVRIV